MRSGSAPSAAIDARIAASDETVSTYARATGSRSTSSVAKREVTGANIGDGQAAIYDVAGGAVPLAAIAPQGGDVVDAVAYPRP